MRSREISFTKSFRFKIVMYSLASLLLTALTEAIGVFVLYQLGAFSRYLRKDSLNNARYFSGSFGPPEVRILGLDIALPDLMIFLCIAFLLGVGLPR